MHISKQRHSSHHAFKLAQTIDVTLNSSYTIVSKDKNTMWFKQLYIENNMLHLVSLNATTTWFDFTKPTIQPQSNMWSHHIYHKFLTIYKLGTPTKTPHNNYIHLQPQHLTHGHMLKRHSIANGTRTLLKQIRNKNSKTLTHVNIDKHIDLTCNIENTHNSQARLTPYKHLPSNLCL